MFESHIDPALAAVTPVVELLRDKAEKVFVPDNWEGITGVPELTLKLKGDMLPVSSKRVWSWVHIALLFSLRGSNLCMIRANISFTVC